MKPQYVRATERYALEQVRAGILVVERDGTIWKVARFSSSGRVVPIQKRRADHVTPGGYCALSIRAGKKDMTVFAHRLAWAYFNGPIPEGFVINHKNGIKSDNRLENIEAITPGANNSHALQTGLRDQRGIANPSAKLSDETIADIRQEYARGGVTQSELAKRHNVAFQHISKIVRGQTRASQPGPIGDYEARSHLSKQDRIIQGWEAALV